MIEESVVVVVEITVAGVAVDASEVVVVAGVQVEPH